MTDKPDKADNIDISRTEAFMAKRSEACAKMLRDLRSGKLSRERALDELDWAEAQALLDHPLTAHPYPVEACRERNRLANLPAEQRRATLERSKDYDGALLYLGRKQHALWYSLVREDLDLYARTIRAIGPATGTGQALAKALLKLCLDYSVETGLSWPRDSVTRDQRPCKVHEAYAELARRWIQNVQAPRSAPIDRMELFR